MADAFETCRDYRAIIPLSLLKISELCNIQIPSRFYESLNEKNRMYELSTFSQIRSHSYVARYLAACLCSWLIELNSKLHGSFCIKKTHKGNYIQLLCVYRNINLGMRAHTLSNTLLEHT